MKKPIEQFSKLKYSYFELIKTHNLSYFDVCLLSVIDSLSQCKGFCSATNEYLAELLYSDKRTIIRSISKMVNNGVISKDINTVTGSQSSKVRNISIIIEQGGDKSGTEVVTKVVQGSDNYGSKVVTDLVQGSDKIGSENGINQSDTSDSQLLIDNIIDNTIDNTIGEDTIQKEKEAFFLSNGELKSMPEEYKNYVYISEVDTIKNHTTKEIFKYVVTTHNMHTKKVSRLSILATTTKNQGIVKAGDVLYILKIGTDDKLGLHCIQQYGIYDLDNKQVSRLAHNKKIEVVDFETKAMEEAIARAESQY